MKINSITTNPSYLKGRAMSRTPNYERDCEKKRHSVNEKNIDQINTTINANNNADGRVSFKGGAPLLHKAASFASDNPLVAEALFAILITCGLRPLTIMATAKTDEEKEKCSYQAAKSVSTGLVGLAMSVLVGTPIAKAVKTANKNGKFKIPPKVEQESKAIVKKGVDALKEFASQTNETGLKQQIAGLITENGMNLNIFKNAGKGAEKTFIQTMQEKAPNIADTVKQAIKAQTTINNYGGTCKNVIDKFFQPIFMPLRATITIALVPIILKALGLKKSSSKPQEAINPYQQLNYNVFQGNTEKEIFKSFMGVQNDANQ